MAASDEELRGGGRDLERRCELVDAAAAQVGCAVQPRSRE
jgi:hypothetical protein